MTAPTVVRELLHDVDVILDIGHRNTRVAAVRLREGIHRVYAAIPTYFKIVSDSHDANDINLYHVKSADDIDVKIAPTLEPIQGIGDTREFNQKRYVRSYLGVLAASAIARAIHSFGNVLHDFKQYRVSVHISHPPHLSGFTNLIKAAVEGSWKVSTVDGRVCNIKVVSVKTFTEGGGAYLYHVIDENGVARSDRRNQFRKAAVFDLGNGTFNLYAFENGQPTANPQPCGIPNGGMLHLMRQVNDAIVFRGTQLGLLPQANMNIGVLERIVYNLFIPNVQNIIQIETTTPFQYEDVDMTDELHNMGIEHVKSIMKFAAENGYEHMDGYYISGGGGYIAFPTIVEYFTKGNWVLVGEESIDVAVSANAVGYSRRVISDLRRGSFIHAKPQTSR